MPEIARPRAIVAILARDEAERIAACFLALDQQSRLPDRVVLLVNNSTDETVAIASTLARRLRYPLAVDERCLPPAQANAGQARRLAMNAAIANNADQDVLLTTDADTIVPPDWIAANLQAIAAGADAVCGCAVIDPEEACCLPAPLRTDDLLERRLIDLLVALAWELDPEPNDPPPRHMEAAGASLAVTAGAYRSVGGMPVMACGEDRAFIRALWMRDAAIRHDPAIRVTVSGRTAGRARGGMADTLCRRLRRQDEYTDEKVEPANDAARRYHLRHQVRLARQSGDIAALPAQLALPESLMRQALQKPYFGECWAVLEHRSSVLQRRRVRFCDLPAEIAAAEQLHRQLVRPDILAAD